MLWASRDKKGGGENKVTEIGRIRGRGMGYVVNAVACNMDLVA